jgi:hypothetical protein
MERVTCVLLPFAHPDKPLSCYSARVPLYCLDMKQVKFLTDHV